MKAKKKKAHTVGLQVVINACHGGFGISEDVVKECVKRGMTVTRYGRDGNYANPDADFCDTAYDRNGKKEKKVFGDRYYVVGRHGAESKDFRTNPIVIEVVKKLEDKANGRFSKLKIVQIPFKDLNGWHIDEYDGWESVAENYRTWG